MYDHDDYPLCLWSLLIVSGIAEGIVRICLTSETGKENCQGWKG